jgi:purine-binding chemotaxis protein CheW
MTTVGSLDILIFSVDGRKHALPLSVVEKVELAVEAIPFPEAPSVVIGAVNWKGHIIAGVSMRRRLHLRERDVRATDYIIIVHSTRRRIALFVDELCDVSTVQPSDYRKAETLSDGLGCVAGATRCEDDIVLIHDLELFLSESDEEALGEL